MARFYYRRYRRYRPRRYVRRWFKRRFRRYVNGSSKSTVRMKTAVETTLTAVNSGYKDHPSGSTAIRAFGSTNDTKLSALNSPLYRTYCNLYEEVKCIGMRVQIAVSTQIGGSTLHKDYNKFYTKEN